MQSLPLVVTANQTTIKHHEMHKKLKN